MRAAVLVASLFAAAAACAEAQESKVRLTTDKPVYKVGSGKVTLTLRNEGTQTVEMSVAPWSIWKGNQYVRGGGVTILIAVALQPGGSKSWTWDKTNHNGTEVGPGTYTVKVGPLHVGNAAFTRSLDIALTPTGKIAGTSRFPLAKGNEWSFVAGPGLGGGPSPTLKMKVTAKNADSSWYKVTNLVGADRWAQLSGSSFWTIVPGPVVDQMRLLFQFGKPVGYSYSVHVAPYLTNTTFKVGAINQTVATPAGTFTGCYRLDLVLPTNAFVGVHYSSFLFAPGVGMVGYTWVTPEGPSVFRLKKAKVKGTDGKFYQVGLNN